MFEGLQPLLLPALKIAFLVVLVWVVFKAVAVYVSLNGVK